MALEFDRIYKEYSALIYRIGILYFKDASGAEDLVQDCFVKLLSNPPKLNGEAHLKGWLIVTARNHCRNIVRRRKRDVPIDENMAFVSPDNSVMNAIMQLEELDRTVIYLHYYEGYATKEIAAMLKVSDNAVRSRLKRARPDLKKFLED